MSLTIPELLQQLATQPTSVDFATVIATIEQHYNYTPQAFSNGVGDDCVISPAGTNAGSCKVFAFGQLQGLSEQQTLLCFGEHYRKVLATPDETDHANIRTFMRHGWAGIRFEGVALQAVGHASAALQFIVQPGGHLQGRVRVPGDKSISHRSIMLGSLADGTTHVSGFLQGEDCLCTLKAFRSMGVDIEGPSANGEVTIHGVGLHGLRAPSTDLDMGNSGTSMRLMSGLMSGQAFDVRMTGDASLSKRPMKRVTVPLASMGAVIEATSAGTPPLLVRGGKALHGIDYAMPMASAQVKSSLLLAGLYAAGETSVTEPAPTRDHTERMLRGFGYEVVTEGNRIRLQGGGRLTATTIDVPSDISSAAFFMVGASIAEGSDLIIEHVGINPTRTGVIDILRLMGANLEVLNEREVGGEPVADIRVRSAALQGIQIPEHLVPLAIDEFPALFIAAAFAQGQTVLTGAEELRVKESDRIQVMADGLIACGVDAQPTPDGIVINPGNFSGGTIESHGDHRIAMSFAMAALRATQPIIINDCANVNTSFPGFVELAATAGVNICTVG